MPAPAPYAGQSWTHCVLTETSDGRRFSPFQSIEAASRLLRDQRLRSLLPPVLGVPVIAVGGKLLTAKGDELASWGEDFDVDEPPRWPTMERNGDGERPCSQCKEPIASGQKMLGGACARCVYENEAAGGDPRPATYALPAPPRAPVEKKAAAPKARWGRIGVRRH